MGIEQKPCDIAIIGMSCRLAGASSPSQLWDNLLNSADVQSKIDRFTGYYHQDGGRRKGLTNVSRAYTIEEGVEKFDNAFFSITPNEATAMDVQQRLLLELTYEAFENAGIPLDDVRGTDTAVYVGAHGVSDYASSLLRDIDATAKYTATGASSSIMANRISYFFDLHGASMLVDTACSSTIVALHQAMATLKSGESKMAVVAGANVILDSAMFVHMSELGFLSPTGRCRSFDAGGDGYARGEGVLALVLKPLEDAVKDCDNIRAVVKATRINQDGRTQGLTLPSSDAQRANLEAIYASNKLNPLDVQYVEAHGTGTAVGDPLELSAINAVFARDREGAPLVVGSIKSNVGHLESGAALGGIVKTVLALEHGQIPPQMHLESLNPKIDWSRTHVPTATEDWPPARSGVRLAGVNSFGFGGTNGHAILQAHAIPSLPSVDYDRPYLFMVSAASKSSLRSMQERLAEHAESKRPHLRSLAHTLLARRSVLKFSRFISARTNEELVEKLRDDQAPSPVTLREEPAESLTFVFTGQGAQWPEMGTQLINMSPLFKSTMMELDGHLARLPDGPDWSIAEELMKPKQTSRVPISSFSQPLCSAIQIGLVEVLKSWGIRPTTVVGHSSGEVAAAYAAGILSCRDAIVVAYYRGLLLGRDSPLDSDSQPAGAMCAVGVSEKDAMALTSSYTGRVVVAAVNSPSSCTLSGDFDAVQEILRHCESEGIFCRALRVDMAYHSHHMLPKSSLYQDAMENAGVCPLSRQAGEQSCKMFSSVFGRLVEAEECTPAYWKNNMVSTVKFYHAVSAAAASTPPQVVLEIGPHAALKGPVGDSFADVGLSDIPYSGTLSRGKPDFESVFATVGFLISNHYSLDLRAINAIEQTVANGNVKHESGVLLADLPGYSWDHSQSFSAESRLSRNIRQREFPRHELLGARLPMDNTVKMMWRNLLMTEEVSWLKEMKDKGHKTLPEGVYVTMSVEAARQVCASRTQETSLIRMSNVHFGAALEMSAFSSSTATVETLFTLSQTSEDIFDFSIVICANATEDSWVEVCSGQLQLLNEEYKPPNRPEAVVHEKEALKRYDMFGDHVIDNMSAYNVGERAISGNIANTGDDLERYSLDPMYLAEIMRLPQHLLNAQYHHPQSLFGLDSITSIDIPAGNWKFDTGIFKVEATHCDADSGSVDVFLFNDDGKSIQIRGNYWKRLGEAVFRPPLRSLFFTPKLEQDISAIESFAELSMQELLYLVSHKWPMADIAISESEMSICGQILPYLRGLRMDERPRFRSLTIVAARDDVPSSSRVSSKSSVDELQANSFHLVFGHVNEANALIGAAKPGGLVCVIADNDDTSITSDESVQLLGKIDGPDSRHWDVKRKDWPSDDAEGTSKVLVFATGEAPVDVFKDKEKYEVVSLDRGTAWAPPSSPVGVIVLDFGRQSILVEWDGTAILLWIQSFLEKTTRLLWVGRDTEQYVAPAFTKTIRAEHPDIKTSTLLLQDASEARVEEFITKAFDNLASDQTEPEQYYVSDAPYVQRYLPDDGLSASVGRLPPYRSSEPLGSREYSLIVSSPGQVELSVGRIASEICGECVEVHVEFSVVDLLDLRKFKTGKSDRSISSQMGSFCAGIVINSTSAKLDIGSRVIAWARGAHAKTITVPEDAAILLGADQEPTNGLLTCYFGFLSLLILATARAGPGDRFTVTPQCPLSTAISSIQKQLLVEAPKPVMFLEKNFEVTVSDERGISVDNCQLDLSGRPEPQLVKMLKEMTNRGLNLCLDLNRFHLSDAQHAFEFAIGHTSTAVVLDHRNATSITNSLIVHQDKANLFRHDRVYVILGLGGLARHIAAWMARNGARHICSLSRRGLEQQEAKPTIENLKTLGCELEVLKANATDLDALSEAFGRIRRKAPIGGILNMAMVLENSPLLSMKPEQWNRAMSAKVASTRNTHMASLKDDLEFFIMFSSISSLPGNRTQANYATANAFQNAFAQYRQSLGLTGMSIALGVVTGIGVLADDHSLLRTLAQTGLAHLDARDVERILEAAVNESRFRDRSLLATGFTMFRTVDGKVQAKPEENQLYWTESAEFGFMLEHNLSGHEGEKEISLLDKLADPSTIDAQKLLLEGVISCLSSVLGYDPSVFDPKSPVLAYGFDSLNAVSVRYWFFTQLGISVPVFDILGSKSIMELVSRSLSRFQALLAETTVVEVPEPRRNIDLAVRPLSHSQQRLFFLQRFIPDKTAFNLLLVCEASGRIDVDRFKAAWTIFLRRHEVLYSRIENTEDGFQQLPHENATFPIEHIVVQDSDFDSATSSLTVAARSFRFRPEEGELVRGYVLESPSRMKFFMVSHHLAWDRSSGPTVFEETSAIYQALGAGRDVNEGLRPEPIQFIDYTIWQNNCIAMPGLINPHIDYWKRMLEGTPDAVTLLPSAITGSRPPVKEYSVNSIDFSLGVELTSGIKEYCKSNAATPFMLLTSTLTALVHRLTGDEDIVIGITDGDRGHTAFDKLVGFTVNMLPIRSKPRSDVKFSALLDEYRTACLEAYEHRAVPFDYLLQVLNLPRRTAHSPVFQISVNYQMQGAFPEVDYGDFRFTRYDHYNAKIQTDFGLDIEEGSDGNMHCTLDYDQNIYAGKGMEKFAEQYKAMIQSIVQGGGSDKIGDLTVVSEEDQRLMEASLRPTKSLKKPLGELDLELLPDLFQRSVSSFPMKIALSDNVRNVTYKELDAATNAIANQLIDSGVKVGDAVGVYCEQSVSLLIAMYGIIKSGGAYVPIDPDYPETRIESMIEDADIHYVLVDNLAQKAITVYACGIDSECVFEIDEAAASSQVSHPSGRLNRPIQPSDPLCCIFTSGSTGRPKGIHLKHSMLRYQQEEYNELLQNSAEDRIALAVTMVFDLSLCTIFGTILLGATAVVATREERYNPAKLVDLLVDERVTSVILSPTQIKALLTAPNRDKLREWGSLRNLTSCGEALPPWTVREFYKLDLPEAKFYNAYAPAETTVVNSMALMQREDADAGDCFIGEPMPTNKFYILDKYRNPVPPGSVGELYIGGVTVASGYLNRPELTEDVFHVNPWATEEEIRSGFKAIYQTGDRFRLTEDGRLHCLGRIAGDRQVKIRGMRTELGEIENAIFEASQSGDLGLKLSLAAVVYPKDESGEGTLVAYLCMDQAGDVSAESQQSFERYLRSALKDALPFHMVPRLFVFAPEIPRTGSGKTDYKALLSLPLPTERSRLGTGGAAAPLTALQKAIAHVWKDALQIEGDLAPSDNFFSLGGHSMMLMDVCTGIRDKTGAEIKLADMFAQPTLEGMETLCLEELQLGKLNGNGLHAAETGNVNDDMPNGHETNVQASGSILTSEKMHLNGSANGNGISSDGPNRNGRTKTYDIDWLEEASLEESANWFVDKPVFEKPTTIAVTGACTMVGSHFLQHVLANSGVIIHCLAVDKATGVDAVEAVFASLRLWKLDDKIPEDARGRVRAYSGSLSSPYLGLNSDQIDEIDTSVQAIYHLDSEVSLLKEYSSIRAGNVDAVKFLLNLAASSHNNPKPIHYLSTWGVPHLQAWTGTSSSSADWLTTETEMSHMTPAPTSDLAYLKCRWACESLVSAAARRGVPATIVRTTMCAPSPATGAAAPPSDINRQIVAGSLAVGAAPDFASGRGGGMSWMTADVLAAGIWHFAHRKMANAGEARFRHVVSGQHVPYAELAGLLSTPEKEVESVTPEEWFRRLRALGRAEMDMHAAVLEKWCQSGWVPFEIDSDETRRELAEAGIRPYKLDRQLMIRCVVGELES